jgi:hypothetical protein
MWPKIHSQSGARLFHRSTNQRAGDAMTTDLLSLLVYKAGTHQLHSSSEIINFARTKQTARKSTKAAQASSWHVVSVVNAPKQLCSCKTTQTALFRATKSSRKN